MKLKNSNIKYPEVRIRDVVSLMWQGMSKNWIILTGVFLGIGGASVFEVMTPIYYKKFFDVLAEHQDKSVLVPQLVHIILVILALNGTAWVLWRFGSASIAYIEAMSMASLRQQAYDRLIYHS